MSLSTFLIGTGAFFGIFVALVIGSFIWQESSKEKPDWKGLAKVSFGIIGGMAVLAIIFLLTAFWPDTRG